MIWGGADVRMIEIECATNVKCLNHPETIPRPGPWRNCLHETTPLCWKDWGPLAVKWFPFKLGHQSLLDQECGPIQLGCCMETGFDVTSLFGRIQGGQGRGGVFIHQKGDRASSVIFFFFSPSRLRRYPETSIAKLEFGLSSSGDSAKQWAGREYESGGGWGKLEKWSLATQRRFWSKPLSTV